MAPNGRGAAGPRCIAIVGPFQSGKTTLLEAILERTGAVSRAGRVSSGDSVGDGSAEARAHGMSIEPNVASVDFLGESMTFVDCPGSTEFMHEMRNVTPVCDAAVVVCEADERKIPALEIILRERPHPEQGFRSSIGIIGLAKAHGRERLEAACGWALTIGARSYTSVKSILKNNLDRRRPAKATDGPAIVHANIRGPTYFH